MLGIMAGVFLFTILLIASISVLFTHYYVSKSLKEGPKEVFYIPESMNQCVGIVHDWKGAPPLHIKNNTIIYRIPENGILKTSSPANFGFEPENNSGWHEIKYYYVDKNRKAIKELTREQNMISHELYSMLSDREENNDKFIYEYKITSFWVGKEKNDYNYAECFEPTYPGQLIEQLGKGKKAPAQ
ncbi:DUF6843 domain-containing protein [Peribacillus kribbensis]|uniref:DUF6843 domain-containing protein n=1 Tax=Peribacillus kribbensis TaxID=356658 RepID=UPI00316AD7FD